MNKDVLKYTLRFSTPAAIAALLLGLAQGAGATQPTGGLSEEMVAGIAQRTEVNRAIGLAEAARQKILKLSDYLQNNTLKRYTQTDRSDGDITRGKRPFEA